MSTSVPSRSHAALVAQLQAGDAALGRQVADCARRAVLARDKGDRAMARAWARLARITHAGRMAGRRRTEELLGKRRVSAAPRQASFNLEG